MSIDAAFGTEVLLHHSSVESINGQDLFARVERDAFGFGANCYCSSHPAIGAVTTPSGFKIVRLISP
jgi:hypothetical protein